jgi:hypothetical protein
MEKMLWQNAKNAKWVIGSFVGGFFLVQQFGYLPGLKDSEVFGYDGNGGRMLKIITNLTDEEIARLKFVRRLHWHWRGSRKMDHGKDVISTQELADRGIAWP